MSHASRREGAVDVPPGYKEEPAPVADDLVSELPVAVRLSFHPSSHPSIHPSSPLSAAACLSLRSSPVQSASSRCSCTGPPRSSFVSALDTARRRAHPRPPGKEARVWLHGMGSLALGHASSFPPPSPPPLERWGMRLRFCVIFKLYKKLEKL